MNSPVHTPTVIPGRWRATIVAGAPATSAAHALAAQIEGILSLARNSQDPADLTVGARGLRGHLESMPPSGVT